MPKGAVNNFLYELVIRVLSRAVELPASLCVEPGGKIKTAMNEP